MSKSCTKHRRFFDDHCADCARETAEQCAKWQSRALAAEAVIVEYAEASRGPRDQDWLDRVQSADMAVLDFGRSILEGRR